MQARTLQIVLLIALVFAAAFLFAQTSVPINQTSQLRRQRFTRQPDSVDMFKVEATELQQATEIERVDVGDDEQDTETSEDSLISGREAARVEVGVYIEALCPDSARFIIYDLADAHFPKDLWDIVEMQYYFWGNVRRADDGTPICQHGAEECELNMLLQCALAELPPNSSPPGEAPVAQKLMECFFEALLKYRGRTDVLHQTAQTCIVAAGASYQAAKGCLKEGTESPPMAAAIKMTDSLVPKHTWVPWVTVNGEAINPKRLGDATHVTKAVCMAYEGDTRCAVVISTVGSPSVHDLYMHSVLGMVFVMLPLWHSNECGVD